MLKGVLEILQPYEADKTVEEIFERYKIPKDSIVKLGSNENPYPPPKSVLAAIAAEAKNINRYPEPGYRELKESLSQYTNLPSENISVGSGASEILSTVSKITLSALDKVAIPVPSYGMYIFFSMIHEANIDLFATKEPCFKLSAEEFIEHAKDAKLVFLSSPNNPTGRTIEREEILKIVENTRGIVAVDEAYYEFSGKTVADRIGEYDNLIVIRSMSKFFGLAGLRVGYALADEKIVKTMEKVRLPFGVSRVAEIATVEALKQVKYFERVREKILKERAVMFKGINRIPGFKALPSEANFLLLRLLENTSGGEFSEMLKRRGIVVRDVSGVTGLKKNYVRISVGKRADTKKLLAAMRKSIYEKLSGRINDVIIK